jgi:hypothetical protein
MNVAYAPIAPMRAKAPVPNRLPAKRARRKMPAATGSAKTFWQTRRWNEKPKTWPNASRRKRGVPKSASEELRVTVQTLLRIQKALEAAGVIFIDQDEERGPGVRLRR